MPAQTNKKVFSQEIITDVLSKNYSELMKEFYEMQSGFFSMRYKNHESIESSNIMICLIRSVHLAIIRQREVNLDYDISFKNFLYNLDKLEIPKHKIVSVVKTTGIPKETVRRKIKNLVKEGFVFVNNHKEYYWYLTPKLKDNFLKVMTSDINMISKFIFKFVEHLNLNITKKTIENEIESQFSFYFYHFLNCQLTWLKLWQTKLKDVDLIFIAMQAIIPTLDHSSKNIHQNKQISIDNLHTIIGEADAQYKTSSRSISATSISEISGIPRATCIRKLEKLVKLGLLVREMKTKRYYVNQVARDRTKHVTKKENIEFSIQYFSNFLSIVITSLNRKNK